MPCTVTADQTASKPTCRGAPYGQDPRPRSRDHAPLRSTADGRDPPSVAPGWGARARLGDRRVRCFSERTEPLGLPGPPGPVTWGCGPRGRPERRPGLKARDALFEALSAAGRPGVATTRRASRDEAHVRHGPPPCTTRPGRPGWSAGGCLGRWLPASSEGGHDEHNRRTGSGPTHDEGTTAGGAALLVPRLRAADRGHDPAPYALGQHATYHYLRRHRGKDGGWCPVRAVVHPCRLAVVPGGSDAADDR